MAQGLLFPFLLIGHPGIDSGVSSTPKHVHVPRLHGTPPGYSPLTLPFKWLGVGGGLLLVAMANGSNSKRRWWNHFVTGAWAKILSAADWANHTGLNFKLRSALVQHNQQNKCFFILHLCICLGSVSCWDSGFRHRNHFGKVWKTVPTAGKSSRLATNFPEQTSCWNFLWFGT